MRRKSITTEMMKSYITDALLILMEKKSFADITVSEIVTKAGVNRSTYYRHFEKKEDVIIYFLENITKEIPNRDEAVGNSIEEHLINVYSHYYRHKKQLLLIYNNGLSMLLLDILKSNLGVQDYKDRQVDEQYGIAFHTGGTFNHFLLWFSRDMTDSPEEMAKHTLAVLPEYYIKYIWGKKQPY